MADSIARIEALLRPILESLGLDLWDIEYRKSGPSWLLRVYIDRKGSGATLDDCTAVSRDLGIVLDVEDIIDHSYTLEVSTPGLDRSLTRPEHYRASIGKMIKIKTFQPIHGQKVFRGRLTEFDGYAVILLQDREGAIKLLRDNISKAAWEISAESSGASF